MFTIVIDTLGSERGSEVSCLAGYRFARETGASVVFVGNAQAIEHSISVQDARNMNYRIVHTTSNVSMAEDAARGIESKPNASISLAFREIQEGRADAVVSAGHTGATVLAAKQTCGTISGVRRSALGQVIPAQNARRCILIDSGAALSATSRDLTIFGFMGSMIARELLGIESPRIGLLNVGSEDSKGNSRLKQTYQLMRNVATRSEKYCFAGNIEGQQIWDGSADVIVTDGCTGNILLKSSEGLIDFCMKSLQQALNGSPGPGIFQKRSYGGALLVGIRGTAVVCHGNAGGDEIERACHIALDCFRHSLWNKIDRDLAQLDLPNNPAL